MNTERSPYEGRPAESDAAAESSIEGLPPFLAPPPNAPVYYGFPLLQASELEGFVFGVITSPKGDQPVRWGDAYVVAPDGSRAGIVWQAEGEPPLVVCEPSPGRWGVYAFRFRHPVRNEADLVKNLHECLPQLKKCYERALRAHPESIHGTSIRPGES